MGCTQSTATLPGARDRSSYKRPEDQSTVATSVGLNDNKTASSETLGNVSHAALMYLDTASSFRNSLISDEWLCKQVDYTGCPVGLKGWKPTETCETSTMPAICIETESDADTDADGAESICKPFSGMTLQLDSAGVKSLFENGTLSVGNDTQFVEPSLVQTLTLTSTERHIIGAFGGTDKSVARFFTLSEHFTNLETLTVDATNFDDELLECFGRVLLEQAPHLQTISLRRFPKYKHNLVIVSPVVSSVTCEYGYFQCLRLANAKTLVLFFTSKHCGPAQADGFFNALENLNSFTFITRASNRFGSVVSVFKSLAGAQTELMSRKKSAMNEVPLKKLVIDCHPEELIGFPEVLNFVEILDAPIPDLSSDCDEISQCE